MGFPPKVNMLLAAPSGSGKTETFRVLKNYFAQEIPHLILDQVDLSNITSAGFKGKDPGSILASLVKEGSSYGIIWLDEIDKRLLPAHTSGGENVSAEIQGQLLAMLEGCTEKYMMKGLDEPVTIDTNLTMFIASGAFNMVREKKKVAQVKTMGFVQQKEKYEIYNAISREDIISMGCLYELLGRFHLLVNYRKLSESAVLKIIELSKSKIESELGMKLLLSEEFTEEMLSSSNQDFGCRLLTSMIYQPALFACKDVFLQGLEHPEVTIYCGGRYEIQEGKADSDYEQSQ